MVTFGTFARLLVLKRQCRRHVKKSRDEVEVELTTREGKTRGVELSRPSHAIIFWGKNGFFVLVHVHVALSLAILQRW